MKSILKIIIALLVIIGGIVVVNMLRIDDDSTDNDGGSHSFNRTFKELDDKFYDEWNASNPGWQENLFKNHLTQVDQNYEFNNIKKEDANLLKKNVCSYAIKQIEAGLEAEWNKPSCQKDRISSIYQGIPEVEKRMKEVKETDSRLSTIKAKKAFFDKVWNFARSLKQDNLGRTPDAEFHDSNCTWTDFADIERNVRSTLQSYMSNPYYSNQFKNITYISGAFNDMTDSRFSRAKRIYYDSLERQLESIYKSEISKISDDENREHICQGIQAMLKAQAGASSDAFRNFTRLILEDDRIQ